MEDDPDIRENIQLQAFRTLRYVFSVERNRKIFKRLFPAEIFELFIDIGHYRKDLEDYKLMVSKFNDLQVFIKDVFPERGLMKILF